MFKFSRLVLLESYVIASICKFLYRNELVLLTVCGLTLFLLDCQAARFHIFVLLLRPLHVLYLILHLPDSVVLYGGDILPKPISYW